MRISEAVALAAMLALAACSPGQSSSNAALSQAEAQQRTEAEEDGRVLCAVGAAPLARVCTVEQAPTKAGLLLTIRRPDGGFRRLLATHDGRGVIAADGAEAARVSVVGPDLIDVALGSGHYRLPATVKHR